MLADNFEYGPFHFLSEAEEWTILIVPHYRYQLVQYFISKPALTITIKDQKTNILWSPVLSRAYYYPLPAPMIFRKYT